MVFIIPTDKEIQHLNTPRPVYKGGKAIKKQPPPTTFVPDDQFTSMTSEQISAEKETDKTYTKVLIDKRFTSKKFFKKSQTADEGFYIYVHNKVYKNKKAKNKMDLIDLAQFVDQKNTKKIIQNETTAGGVGPDGKQRSRVSSDSCCFLSSLLIMNVSPTRIH